jgi:hypothetical protein
MLERVDALVRGELGTTGVFGVRWSTIIARRHEVVALGQSSLGSFPGVVIGGRWCLLPETKQLDRLPSLPERLALHTRYR